MNENYIYEVEGFSLPFDKYENDSNNIFYYYKRQTPKQTITVKHAPNSPTEVDIYDDPKYHDVDTDEEIDMDYYENDGETGKGSNEHSDNEDDLLNRLTKYLATIPSVVNIPRMNIAVTEERPKRLTKKQRVKHLDRRKTKHANRALPKSFY
jgi:hypothetical protein